MVVAPVAAQMIDPSILARVQGQLGASQSSSVLLDQSRSGNNSNTSGGVDFTNQDGGATAEELELRRQRSRLKLDELYAPSRVETEFRERLADPDLRQFGYDLFRSTEGRSATVTGEVGGNYILGIGDELVVSFQGASNDSETVRVDREGRLVVGQLRPVRAAGRSLSAVRSELAAETRRTLLGTEVYVSLGSVRAISVFVGGEVERPGQYQMTSLGDVATALSRAGGIRKTGSLRSVRVIRGGGGSTTVDLYGLLGIGTPSGVRLQDGDRIVVPVISSTVAVSGAVARPGIYELRTNTTLDNLIDYAGGALRPRGYKAAISRIAPDGTESFIRVSGGGQTIIPGDAVQVVGGSAGGALNRVTLRGYVINPGPRPLTTAETVSELLGDQSSLRLGTYLPMALLVRRDPVTSSRAFEAVNLIDALRDGASVPLRSDDRLFVFGQSDIDFMNSELVRKIVLGEENPYPQCRSLTRLRTLVENAQLPRFTAITRGGFTIERPKRDDPRSTRASDAGAIPTRTEADRRRELGTSGDPRDEDSLDRELTEDEAIALERRRLLARQDRATGRVIVGSLDDQPVCPEVFEEEPDLLPVLIEHAVSVGGAVRQPGAYPIASATTASALVSVAQGLAANARDVQIDVIRATGIGSGDRVPAGADGMTALASVQLLPGDDLRVNAAQPQFESGGVLLSGEFNRPGFYTIRKGETLSQLTARAGGLSPFAYPYGAIFTRRTVKELQEEGFRRTARELNAGLLSAISRRGAEAGSLIAATDLIDRLTMIEAPGRMVIEADPQVLAVRPELDTVLEAGDAIVMPKTPNFVLALGDVSNPGALQFTAGKSTSDYLRDAGGLQRSAGENHAFLVLPNGTAQPLRSSGWRRTATVVPPGSTIIVPKDIDSGRSLAIATALATIFGQVATAVASIAILASQ